MCDLQGSRITCHMQRDGQQDHGISFANQQTAGTLRCKGPPPHQLPENLVQHSYDCQMQMCMNWAHLLRRSAAKHNSTSRSAGTCRARSSASASSVCVWSSSSRYRVRRSSTKPFAKATCCSRPCTFPSASSRPISSFSSCTGEDECLACKGCLWATRAVVQPPGRRVAQCTSYDCRSEFAQAQKDGIMLRYGF